MNHLTRFSSIGRAPGLTVAGALALTLVVACGEPTTMTTPPPGDDGGEPMPERDGGGDPLPTDDASTPPGDDGGTPSPTGVSCSEVSLFAGNPLHSDPTARPAEGTAITADPPLPYREIVRVGTRWYTITGAEVWTFSDADPTLDRIAGDESDAFDFRAGGSCADARFNNLQDLVALPDGDLVVVGHNEGAAVLLHDPSGTCEAHYLVGLTEERSFIDPTSLDWHGNELGDGTGAQAQLAIPDLAVVASDGTLYILDYQASGGDGRVVRVEIPSGYSGDPATVAVSEVARLEHTNLQGAAIVGDTLYYTGTQGAGNAFIGTVDVTTGTTGVLFGGSGSVWGTGSSAPVSTDLAPFPADAPTGLIGLEWKRSQMYYVPLDGSEITYVAGQEGVARFPSGYDPHVSDPAEVVFQTKSGGTQRIAYLATVGSEVYTSLYGTNHYIHRLVCAD